MGVEEEEEEEGGGGLEREREERGERQRRTLSFRDMSNALTAACWSHVDARRSVGERERYFVILSSFSSLCECMCSVVCSVSGVGVEEDVCA